MKNLQEGVTSWALSMKEIFFPGFFLWLIHHCHHFQFCFWWRCWGLWELLLLGKLVVAIFREYGGRGFWVLVPPISFVFSCLFLLFPVGPFGHVGPGRLLGNCQLDTTGVLQSSLHGERLRTILEETYLQNYFKTGQWYSRDFQVFQLSSRTVPKLSSYKVRWDC